jgi:cellulose synthase/poly-beta-1,6-N-acetylglucosamine synthase-like glycosyltransferase
MNSIWVTFLTVIISPCFIAAEIIVSMRNRLFHIYSLSNENHADYKILVPIWGNIKYLENVKYLSKYGSRVILCTTGNESEEFYTNLEALAKKYNFLIFKDKPKFKIDKKRSNSEQRTTSGSMRDTIIRNVLHTVKTPFVVTLDADSTTVQDISFLVGELEHKKYDIASIRIVPNNTHASVLTQLQTFEYDTAMNFRFLCPWLISGACHVAKTAILRNIMDRHSLFFQGNDVETGLLAITLGYNVGHIPFIVLTAVPDSLKSWYRQRLAWSGGEFRLFIVNFKFIFKHPFFWFYGAIVVILMFPLRWLTLFITSIQFYIIIGLYVGLTVYNHWIKKNWYLFLMPIYMLFTSLIMVPLGIIWYFYMAYKDKNFGIIKTKIRYKGS